MRNEEIVESGRRFIITVDDPDTFYPAIHVRVDERMVSKEVYTFSKVFEALAARGDSEIVMVNRAKQFVREFARQNKLRTQFCEG